MNKILSQMRKEIYSFLSESYREVTNVTSHEEDYSSKFGVYERSYSRFMAMPEGTKEMSFFHDGIARNTGSIIGVNNASRSCDIYGASFIIEIITEKNKKGVFISSIEINIWKEVNMKLLGLTLYSSTRKVLDI